ncbi:MAG: hypothetical protein H0U74_17225 [Bradymonadaceae bacterium]|nr:hypothetical protein [Lujinxingiaceae bacterium]
MTNHWSVRLLVAAAALSTGCVTYSHASLPQDARFELLYERKLAAFEQRVAMERHTASGDDWTSVAEGWVALINCRKVANPEDLGLQDPLARVVYAGLVLEDARRERMLGQALTARTGTWGRDTIFARLHHPDFFDRVADHLPPGYIYWLPEDESWVDELPAPLAADSGCDELRKSLAESVTAAPSDGVVAQDWVALEISAVEAVLAAGRALSDDQGGESLTRLLWHTRVHGAQLLWSEARKLERDDGADPEKIAALHREALAHLEAASRYEVVELVDSGERSRMELLHGVLLAKLERPSDALGHLARAEALGLSDDNHWGSRYLRLRLLMNAALWEDAAALTEKVPPQTSRFFSPYAYYGALSLRRVGLEDRFLALAMAAFRDRPYEADPFMRGLYAEVLQTIADYPFEARTIELLEEMGPRNKTFGRVEEFAAVSLDRGRPENAAAAARWLLARQTDAREHPRFYALLALSAFLDDNERVFVENVAKITARPDKLLDVVPQHRRSSFFAHADAELARALRLMLPVMAEWGETPRARVRRQKWLRIIVAQTQGFLRETNESLARPALVELYRLASAMLDDHPRGYAERVGATDAAPLVLGTVQLNARQLAQFEPPIEPTLSPVFSLALVPRDEVQPANWPSFFTEPESAGARP